MRLSFLNVMILEGFRSSVSSARWPHDVASVKVAFGKRPRSVEDGRANEMQLVKGRWCALKGIFTLHPAAMWLNSFPLLERHESRVSTVRLEQEPVCGPYTFFLILLISRQGFAVVRGGAHVHLMGWPWQGASSWPLPSVLAMLSSVHCGHGQAALGLPVVTSALTFQPEADFKAVESERVIMCRKTC